MGEMRVMDSTGDSKTVWNIDNQDEIDAARSTFDKLRGKGYSAFRVKKDGDKGERMDSFDPNAGMLIMVPPLKGG